MRRAVAAALALLASACGAPGQPTEGVLLDGLFDEWADAATLVDDPPDAPDAAVDILSVQALDDATWLHLAVDVGNEVSLQGLPGTLHLLFDVDADRSTGGSTFGMDGVDLIVDLSQAATPMAGGRRAGFGLRVVDATGSAREAERHALGLMAAPTWSAPRFELRVSRLGAQGIPAFGSRLRMKAVYADSDALLDETEVGSYAFRSPASETRPLPDDAEVAARMARPPGAVRVAQWNVASGTFSASPLGFARVLAALDPDVILLDEIPSDVTPEWLAAFFELPPLRELGSWTAVLGETGRIQKSAVAVRGYGIERVSSLSRVPYPQGAVDALVGSAPDGLREYLAAERDHGVSVVGAWVEIEGRRVLLVATDLQSGGWRDSPRDRMRTVQATTIHAHIADVLLASPAPVVIGGDLNLVGSRAPLFALVRGLDVDGSDLVPVDAQRLAERTLATWRLPRDVFAPGRLDFLLVPDAAVEVANSFVFATDDLGDPTLARLGLERDLMPSLSDHLVVVADLRFGATGGAGDGTPSSGQP